MDGSGENKNYEWAAEQLGCDVASIKAVAFVESSGSGFLENGKPKILFEALHFSKLTGGKYNKIYPQISSPVWNRKLYLGGIDEYKRFDKAAELDWDAAVKATSWGKFQLMGFNWKACGFQSLQEFFDAVHSGELGQLKAFVGFLKAMRLQAALKTHNWKVFARAYNGPGFEFNQYDVKLAKAYEKFRGYHE